MRRLFTRLAAAVALIAFAATGCGESEGGPKGKVSGAVTFNGKSVEDGYIVFRPADGKGSDAGGPITGGKYTLSAVPVGPKTVVISSAAAGPPPTGGPMSSEDASKAKSPDPKKSAENIPLDAKGNNAKVEVKTGDQSFDFALKP